MATTTSQFPLLTRDFDTILSDQTATLASSLSANTEIFQTLDLTAGSPMLALMESNAGLALFMQFLAYQVLRSTRLATSEGDDLDSFGADFLFARYPAVPASGQVLFSRATAANIGYIPVNTLIRTNDGQLSFVVIPPAADPGNTFDPINGYTLLPNVYQISVLVQSVIPGTIGNIPANALGKIATSLPVSASSVYNPSAFFNGSDQATDAQYRSAFALYIKSRDNATVAALQNAIATTNPNYTYSIQENYITSEQPLPGTVLIYFDDGTGFVSTQRQVELQNAINAVRPASVTAFVIAASPISMIVEMQTVFPNTAIRNANIGVISSAVSSYINSLHVGQNLILTRLAQVIYNACPALTEVYNIRLQAIDINGNSLSNNGVGDVVVTPSQVLRFLPNPPLVNGTSSIQPSIVVID